MQAFEMQNIRDRGAEAAFFNYISQFYTMECTYTATGKIEYIGYAQPGTDTSDSTWLIIKCSYDVNDRIISRKFAGGHHVFLYCFDDKATYTYS